MTVAKNPGAGGSGAQPRNRFLRRHMVGASGARDARSGQVHSAGNRGHGSATSAVANGRPPLPGSYSPLPAGVAEPSGVDEALDVEDLADV